MDLKAHIESADQALLKKVNVPEWKCDVWVRAMNASEREQYETKYLGNAKKVVMAALVVSSACDAEGKKLWSDADLETVERLNGKAVQRLFHVSLKLNRYTNKDVQEMLGEFEADPE